MNIWLFALLTFGPFAAFAILGAYLDINRNFKEPPIYWLLGFLSLFPSWIYILLTTLK
jgi:hypothetical protein